MLSCSETTGCPSCVSREDPCCIPIALGEVADGLGAAKSRAPAWAACSCMPANKLPPAEDCGGKLSGIVSLCWRSGVSTCICSVGLALAWKNPSPLKGSPAGPIGPSDVFCFLACFFDPDVPPLSPPSAPSVDGLGVFGFLFVG